MCFPLVTDRAADPFRAAVNRGRPADVTRGMSTAHVVTRAGNPGWLAARLAGAGLLAATGAIHLDLYLTGYRTIPVIGWLFLLQVIAAFALALAVLLTAGPLAPAAGAGFALATLGGYLLSLWFGLFGFREIRTTAGIAAGIVEIAAFGVLAVLALRPGVTLPGWMSGLPRVPARIGAAAAAAACAAALAVLGVSAALAGTGQPAAGGGAGLLKTARIGGVTVLTNASGQTLYWFAPDIPSHSACSGSCAAYWPPVRGPVTAGSGVSGKLTVITRPGGLPQAVYDGHPLYTYVGDSGPGQARGNNLNLNGGLWHEVTVPG